MKAEESKTLVRHFFSGGPIKTPWLWCQGVKYL